jgi:hypothetical protein
MAYGLAAILTFIATLAFAGQSVYISVTGFGDEGSLAWWVEGLGKTMSCSRSGLLLQLVDFLFYLLCSGSAESFGCFSRAVYCFLSSGRPRPRYPLRNVEKVRFGYSQVSP